MTKLPTPMSEKSEGMKDTIEGLFPGTKQAITEKKCPLCRGTIRDGDFRNSLSIREYGISGMCQTCQDGVFGEG